MFGLSRQIGKIKDHNQKNKMTKMNFDQGAVLESPPTKAKARQGGIFETLLELLDSGIVVFSFGRGMGARPPAPRIFHAWNFEGGENKQSKTVKSQRKGVRAEVPHGKKQGTLANCQFGPANPDLHSGIFMVSWRRVKPSLSQMMGLLGGANEREILPPPCHGLLLG